MWAGLLAAAEVGSWGTACRILDCLVGCRDLACYPQGPISKADAESIP